MFPFKFLLFKIQLVEANCSKNSTRNVSKIPGFRSWNFSHNVSRILEKIVDQLLLHPEFCSNCWIGEFTGWCFLFFLQECEKKNRWPLNEDFHSQWDHYLCIESFSLSFVNLSLVKLIVFWGDFFLAFWLHNSMISLLEYLESKSVLKIKNEDW